MTRKYATMKDRIMANVQFVPAPKWALVDGDCWEWRGALNARGYGQITVYVPGRKHNKKHLMHRFVLWIFCGIPLESIECSMHFCGNKKCCNPAHLEKGTQEENRIMHHEIEKPLRTEYAGEFDAHAQYTEADFIDWPKH